MFHPLQALMPITLLIDTAFHNSSQGVWGKLKSGYAFNVEAWRLAYVYLLATGRSCKFFQHHEVEYFGALSLVRD